jgi:hypothetical protein
MGLGLALGACFGLWAALGRGAGGGACSADFTIFTGTRGPSLTFAEMAADKEMIPAAIATWAADEQTRYWIRRAARFPPSLLVTSSNTVAHPR